MRTSAVVALSVLSSVLSLGCGGGSSGGSSGGGGGGGGGLTPCKVIVTGDAAAGSVPSPLACGGYAGVSATDLLLGPVAMSVGASGLGDSIFVGGHILGPAYFQFAFSGAHLPLTTFSETTSGLNAAVGYGIPATTGAAPFWGARSVIGSAPPVGTITFTLTSSTPTATSNCTYAGFTPPTCMEIHGTLHAVLPAEPPTPAYPNPARGNLTVDMTF